MRRAARTDANHAAIRTAFKRCGCSVLDTFTLGKDAPDMLVGCLNKLCGGRISFLVEAKDGDKCPSKRALTDGQREFHHDWLGPIYVVESPADVPATILAACRDCKASA